MAATIRCRSKVLGPFSSLLQICKRNIQTTRCSTNLFRKFSDFKDPNDPVDPNDPQYQEKYEKPPHIETPTKHSMDMLSPEPVKGKIFDKFPHRIKLEAGKKYLYCTCGYSKKQPFCDGSHKAPHYVSTKPHHIKYRPIKFKVEETKEYWLCICKQSDKRPFCDGSHKRPEVQEAVR